MPTPRLTVSILTKNSEQRLGRLLAEVANFADEVIVGVDASSTDRTIETAESLADIVYQFRHSGNLSSARMLLFDYASGDWVLSLDDDEQIEASFDAIVPELLADSRVTHHWFPRKWIVNLDPCEYVHETSMFPDWQLRLFRNDRSLVRKPPRPHSGYCVQGPGFYETRAAILHFEPIWCDADARSKKLEMYRLAGGDAPNNAAYAIPPSARRRAAALRPPPPPRRRVPAGIVHNLVHEPATPSVPWWCSEILAADMPLVAHAGEEIVAEVLVRNTGSMTWTPPAGGRSALVHLGDHLLDSQGKALERDRRRCQVPRFVPPGDSLLFYAVVDAPALPGDYLVEWDMVSEGECWFADCGGVTLRKELRVNA